VVGGCIKCFDFVLELVSEVGRPARPRVMRVGGFSVVEASRRASLVRVGTWSRCFIRRFGSFRLCGQSSWRGFFRGLFFLIVDCGYPLFGYLTARYSNGQQRHPTTSCERAVNTSSACTKSCSSFQWLISTWGLYIPPLAGHLRCVGAQRRFV
jgi:hypothetical protein